MRKREFTNRMSLRGAYLYATWQSQQNKIIGRDPHVSPMDFLRMTIRMISRDPHVGFSILLRMTIFKIGRPLEFFALQKIGVIVCYILISSTSMTATANAECVPTPDCASIGYTATSCESGFVRCPFDTSKLLCIPCDTKYKYTCSGDNIIGGTGSPCNGKYISCECSSGGTFNNGECPQNCEVGYIYYSDKSCSSSYDSSKNAIGVVVKYSALVTALNVPDMRWASGNADVSGLTNVSSMSDAKTDMNGKANTLAIVSTYTSNTTSNNAAVYCNSYTTSGTSAGDWYLPSAGELYDYIYSQYSTVKSGWDKVGTTISDSWFWSSSEYNYYGAIVLYSVGGDINNSDKNAYSYSVSCFLDISGNG